MNALVVLAAGCCGSERTRCWLSLIYSRIEQMQWQWSWVAAAKMVEVVSGWTAHRFTSEILKDVQRGA